MDLYISLVKNTSQLQLSLGWQETVSLFVCIKQESLHIVFSRALIAPMIDYKYELFIEKNSSKSANSIENQAFLSFTALSTISKSSIQSTLELVECSMYK